jgi:hypothetical protein
MNTHHRSGAQTGISRHWLDVLEENNVRFMALHPQHDHKLIEQLKTRQEWIVEYADDEAIFFVRGEMPVSNYYP